MSVVVPCNVRLRTFAPILDQYKLELNLKKREEYLLWVKNIEFAISSIVFTGMCMMRSKSNRPRLLEKRHWSPSKVNSTISHFWDMQRKNVFINLLAVCVTRIKKAMRYKQEIPESVRKFYNPFMDKGTLDNEILLPFFEMNLIFPKDFARWGELIYLYYMFTVGQSYSQESLQRLRLQSPMYMEWLSEIDWRLDFIDRTTNPLFPLARNERKLLFINATYIFFFLINVWFGENKIDSFGDYITLSEIERQYHYWFTVLEKISLRLRVRK